MYLAVLALAAPAPARGAAPATTPAPAPSARDQGDSPSPAPGSPAPPDAGADAPSGDAPAPASDKVTRYSFTGLDIDGELRTPALLQFLARIAGEFETVGIPHRSFMPELRATVGEDAL